MGLFSKALTLFKTPHEAIPQEAIPSPETDGLNATLNRAVDPARVANILNGLGYGIMKADAEPGILLDKNTGRRWDLRSFREDESLRRLDNGETIRADPMIGGMLAHDDGSLGAAQTLIQHMVMAGARPLSTIEKLLELKYVFRGDGGKEGITVLVRCLPADTENGTTHFLAQVVKRLSDGQEVILGTFAGSHLEKRYGEGPSHRKERLHRMRLLVESGLLLRGMDDSALGERLKCDDAHEIGAILRRTGNAILAEIRG